MHREKWRCQEKVSVKSETQIEGQRGGTRSGVRTQSQREWSQEPCSMELKGFMTQPSSWI